MELPLKRKTDESVSLSPYRTVHAQTHRHRERAAGLKGEREREREGLYSISDFPILPGDFHRFPGFRKEGEV